MCSRKVGMLSEIKLFYDIQNNKDGALSFPSLCHPGPIHGGCLNTSTAFLLCLATCWSTAPCSIVSLLTCRRKVLTQLGQ